MEKWKNDQYYIGEDYSNYYILLGTNRDADCITRANFQAAITLFEDNKIKVYNAEDTNKKNVVLNARFNHWAVGWIELILIPEKNKKAVNLGIEIEEKLANYPILDEMLFSEIEYNEVSEYWFNMSIDERIYYCKQSNISIFNARKNDFSLVNDSNGELYQYLATP